MKQPCGRDTGPAGRLRIVANGVDVASPGRLAEDEPDQQVDQQHQNRPVGDGGLRLCRTCCPGTVISGGKFEIVVVL